MGMKASTSVVRYRSWGVAVVVLSAVFLAGCGGSSSSSSGSSAVPASVVQSVATVIAGEAATNLATGSGAAVVRHADRLRGHVEPMGVVCNNNSCVVSEQFNTTQACQFGGSTGFAGDLSGSINNSGTGGFQFQVDETFTNCSPVSGYTVNGAPEVTVAGSINFNGGVVSFPLQFEEGGAVTINGNTCNINLTTLAESDGSSTTTGTLCGQAVNLSVQ
jgi:hypothetical protein